MRYHILRAIFLSCLVTASLAAQPEPNDSAAVIAIVEAFHTALAAGDSATVLRLLADDALVLEEGRVESRPEYAAHHLASDIQFARAVPSKRSLHKVVVLGDAAWAVYTSETSGAFGGRRINRVGVELVVLSRGAAGWRITAIHWSNGGRPPGK